MKDDRLTLEILYRRKERLGAKIKNTAVVVAVAALPEVKQTKVEKAFMDRQAKMRLIDAEIERIENEHLPEHLR